MVQRLLIPVLDLLLLIREIYRSIYRIQCDSIGRSRQRFRARIRYLLLKAPRVERAIHVRGVGLRSDRIFTFAVGL